MAIDIYLKVGDIRGEAKEVGHKDWIMLESVSWNSMTAGVAQRGGGLVGGKAQISDFHFVKMCDTASPKLMEACASAQVFPEIKIEMIRMPGRHKYMDYKLSNAIVSSFQTSGSAASAGVPTESLSMSFTKIEFTFYPQKEDGTSAGGVPVTYDLKQAMKL
jgi:type VI secretion system secreted protein Hcp